MANHIQFVALPRTSRSLSSSLSLTWFLHRPARRWLAACLVSSFLTQKGVHACSQWHQNGTKMVLSTTSKMKKSHPHRAWGCDFYFCTFWARQHLKIYQKSENRFGCAVAWASREHFSDHFWTIFKTTRNCTLSYVHGNIDFVSKKMSEI